MSTDPWPEGYDWILHEELDSTNAEAARIAEHLHRPTWIMARNQTNARGRRGRRWSNPKGNFSATLVLKPLGGPQAASLRSFMAANALYETLSHWCDRSALSLKWPNDVLLNGGKVAGILLESAGRGGATEWLSIGIGVNLLDTPDGVRDPSFPPVCVKTETGERIEPDDFLRILADNYATEEMILDRLGFQPIRQRWLERAARLGEIITARTVRDEVTGRFATVDELGQLVLETPRGRVAIPAADVYF